MHAAGTAELTEEASAGGTGRTPVEDRPLRSQVKVAGLRRRDEQGRVAEPQTPQRRLAEVEEQAGAESELGAPPQASPAAAGGPGGGYLSSSATSVAKDAAAEEASVARAAPVRAAEASPDGDDDDTVLNMNRWAMMVVAALATLGVGVLLSLLVWLLRRRKTRDPSCDESEASRRPANSLDRVQVAPPVPPLPARAACVMYSTPYYYDYAQL